ncbi:hypothetical protein AX16_002419 [Volvariella volvacea WC 439]|nr:hypothetical protein AX16_002419 [Volvariella volvacea WC 439]
MTSLFKHLRVHQVFGANTDVGKTVLTAALVRASTSRGIPTHYLKPVSTGRPEDADDRYIRTHGGPSQLLNTTCLYRFNEPVSPHLAAREMPSSVCQNFSFPFPTLANNISDTLKRDFCSEHNPFSSSKGRRSTNATLLCGNCWRSDHYSTSEPLLIHRKTGVHSPTPDGTSQVESYRPLFLPTILIGDHRLGGISTTISAYEALRIRGYVIDAVLMFKDEYYRNWEFLSEYFDKRGIPLTSVDAPPAREDDAVVNLKLTSEYYERVVPKDNTGPLFTLLDLLDRRHLERMRELYSMPKRAADTLWWPFVQHGLVQEKDVTVIDSAHRDFFSVHNPTTFNQLSQEFDGSASWWTQALGHAQTDLTLAAAEASGRYGHVLFPQAVHLPALRLAEWLVQEGPGRGWANRVFYSDDGSTAMEVALKMALRYFTINGGVSGNGGELGVLGLKGSYHGDTIGAMDACEKGVYTCEWHKPKGIWIDPPTLKIKDGHVQLTLPPSIDAHDVRLPSLQQAYNVTKRLSTPLASLYRKYITDLYLSAKQNSQSQIAALIVEPLVMGAGGMLFVDPLFQRILIDVVRDLSGQAGATLPVIFDEVFVGLYRTGFQTAAAVLGVYPDISVNAKILTGGLVPMAVTLASEKVFNAFLSASKADALLHGHSYTAHPMGCQVAIETLKQISQLQNTVHWIDSRARWVEEGPEHATVWSFWHPEFVDQISRSCKVEGVMALGTVLAIKLRGDCIGYQSNHANTLFAPIKNAKEEPIFSAAPGGTHFGVNFRTLGDVAYFMTSLNTPPTIIKEVENKIWGILTSKS